MNKDSIWFWRGFAIAGWGLAFWGSYTQGELIQQWQDASLEMFQRACNQEQGRFFVGLFKPGHMIQFNCHDKDPLVDGVLFSLPPMPDDGARP